MYNKILIPLDGSQLAEQVISYSAALAKRFDSTVYLVQVVPLAGQATAMSLGGVGVGGMPDLGAGALSDVEFLEAEVRRAKSYLDSVATKLKADGLKVEWEVRRGIPADEVVKVAKEREVDIITISTHGRSGLGRLVFGSVADRVIRDAGKPVLLIKPVSKEKSTR